MNKYISSTPSPFQSELVSSTALFNFFFGDQGSGKSTGLLIDALRNVDKSQYNAIIFKRNRKELQCGVEQAKRWFEKHNDVWFEESASRFNFPSKAQLRFCVMDSMDEACRHAGAIYGFMEFDEIPDIEPYGIEYLCSRTRVPQSWGFNPKVVFADRKKPEKGWKKEMFEGKDAKRIVADRYVDFSLLCYSLQLDSEFEGRMV